MQAIQVKTEEYQLLPSTDNLFHLRPLPSHSSAHLDLQYNYAPLLCSYVLPPNFRKTEKIIRTLPSISEEKSYSTLFYTQFDLEFNLKNPQPTPNPDPVKSMKNLAQTEKNIYLSKPSSRYCQICKDTFLDYLQHINHSSHQKNLKLGTVTDKDFLQIQTILKNKNLLLQKKSLTPKPKLKVAFGSQNPPKNDQVSSKKPENLDSRDPVVKVVEAAKNEADSRKEMEIFEEEKFLSSMSLGSKKRMQFFIKVRVENDSGEKEFVLLNLEKSLKISESDEERDLKREPSLKTIDSAGTEGNKLSSDSK